MRILVITHSIPSPFKSDTSPVLHIIKNLCGTYKHEVSIVSFMSNNGQAKDCDEINKMGLRTIEIPFPVKLDVNTGVFSFKEILYTIKNNIRNCGANARHGLLINLLDCYYSSKMYDVITNLVTYEHFDIIIVTRPMINYALDIKIPKLIHPLDAVYFWHKQNYIRSVGLKKLVAGLLYILTRDYEKHLYSYYDQCLTVTEEDQSLLKRLNPEIQCSVLPCGVDIDYFHPIHDITDDEASLVFLSGMSSYPARVNVLSFYNQTFPLIRSEIPEVKLYLVGRDPNREIVDLACDQNVIVTGFVDDVRTYLAKASVIIAPLVVGTGIKLKVLEAMAMGKPVVTTSLGIQGIKGINGQDFIVADNPQEYARYVVNMLRDAKQRAILGNNARINVESMYSWSKISHDFNEIMLRTVMQSTTRRL